jgi:protein-disulfide isomerase
MASIRPGRDVPPPSKRAVVLAFSGAAAAAVALVVVALFFRSEDTAPLPTPTPVVDLKGIPQDGAVLGAADTRVTLIEYADPQCPGCRFYTEEMFPAIVNEYVRPGTVKTEFRGFPFIGEDSVKALRFILAAGLQDRLWQLQEALYRNQGGENDGWVTDDLIRGVATEIAGLDVDRLFADAESEEIVSAVEEAAPQAAAAGIRGTPTLLIKIGDAEPYAVEGGLDLAQLRAALDDALSP